MATLHDFFSRLTLRAGHHSSGAPIASQVWPAASEGRRVVIENEDAMWQWAATRILESAGYEVACCSGPRHLPHGRCPLVAGNGCSLVDEADVVVSGLGIADPANRAVLTALRTQRGQIPVIAEVPPRWVTELQTEFAGCRTVPHPVGPKELVDAVDDALSRPGDARTD